MENDALFQSLVSAWFDNKIRDLKKLQDIYVGADNETEVCQRIFKLLCNRSTIISPVPTASQERLSKLISESVSTKNPIRLNTPFGCYKPRTLPSPTTANWAEYFHLIHIIEIAAKIRSFYKPSVIIMYKLGDIDMDILADVTNEEVRQYYNSFVHLVNGLNGQIAPSITFEVTRLSDCVSRKKYRDDVQHQIDRLLPIWNKDKETPTIKQTCDRALRNNENRQLSTKKVFDVALRSEAMVTVDLDYLANSDAVNLIYREIPDRMDYNQDNKTLFPFRSIKGSLVQFWVGEGGFGWNGKKVYPVIIGRNYLTNNSPLCTLKWHRQEEYGANYQTISIYKI